jgi:osmotically-inducible protein OsmY
MLVPQSFCARALKGIRFLFPLILATQMGCQSYVDGHKRTPGEIIDDTQIKASVKLKLLNDPEVKGVRIGVSVYRAVVTLSGRVPSEYSRKKAHQVTSEVRGVESTVDKLTIVE